MTFRCVIQDNLSKFHNDGPPLRKLIDAMTRVVIVDDNEVIRDGLMLSLSVDEKYLCVAAHDSCEKAIRNFEIDRADVVLMDMELPGMTGVQGIEKIKLLKPEVNILVITVHENTDLVFKALASGAIGYITKSKSNFFTTVGDAIDEMLSGGSPMSSSIARLVVNSFQKNINSPLSMRETKVLELLAKGKSYSIIAEELFIAKATVRAHIRNIYDKLHVNSKSSAIEKAIAQKLI